MRLCVCVCVYVCVFAWEGYTFPFMSASSRVCVCVWRGGVTEEKGVDGGEEISQSFSQHTPTHTHTPLYTHTHTGIIHQFLLN